MRTRTNAQPLRNRGKGFRTVFNLPRETTNASTGFAIPLYSNE
jgi:hypothetical protein